MESMWRPACLCIFQICIAVEACGTTIPCVIHGLRNECASEQMRRRGRRKNCFSACIGDMEKRSFAVHQKRETILLSSIAAAVTSDPHSSNSLGVVNTRRIRYWGTLLDLPTVRASSLISKSRRLSGRRLRSNYDTVLCCKVQQLCPVSSHGHGVVGRRVGTRR